MPAIYRLKMLYPLKSPDILHYLAKISFLYNITRFFISCLLSFTIIFFPVVSVSTVSGVSSTNSIRSGFTNTLTPLIFVTSIMLPSPILPCGFDRIICNDVVLFSLDVLYTQKGQASILSPYAVKLFFTIS